MVIGCCCRRTDVLTSERTMSRQIWRIFSLAELQSATNYFNYDNKLGEGGHGSVYWGQLWDGSQIAVKRLKYLTEKAEKEFAGEAEVLANIRHKNLLSFRGYCAQGQERLVVYDFMPNLSLYSHLHGRHAAGRQLNWGTRMRIAIDSADAINFLHHDAQPNMVHGDVKSSNILLDTDFNTRVADFGFTKFVPDGETAHVSAGMKGRNSHGYLPPEHAVQGKQLQSCDVFSFGILLLELASGKKPAAEQTVVEWALALSKEGKFADIADPMLGGEFTDSELKTMVLVGLACSQSASEKRPRMSTVSDFLKGNSPEKLGELEKDPLFRSSPEDDPE